MDAKLGKNRVTVDPFRPRRSRRRRRRAFEPGRRTRLKHAAQLEKGATGAVVGVIRRFTEAKYRRDAGILALEML